MRIDADRALSLLFIPLLFLSAGKVSAAGEAVLPDGLVVDLRYRDAHIDQAGFADSANANTLRITLGYLMQFAPQWSGYAEGTRVVVFGDNYNSGANGRTKLPAEGDPPSSEISSAWLGFNNGTVQARLGRQYVNLDNQRFFTSGLWRQNPQSFDAVNASWSLATGTTLQYLHLDKALRSVGHDYPDPTQSTWSLDANLFHFEQKLPLGRLAGYDYLVENDTTARYSWRTAGLRWTGSQTLATGVFNWAAEGARQSSWRNNPSHYDADYHLLDASYGTTSIAIRLGDELLGGDGRNAFSSPYGSNHGFDGWTNQFKNTPPKGLEDRYAGAFGKIAAQWTWSILAHNFFAARGEQRYGSEVNALLGYDLRNGFSVEANYANYHRNTFGASERALWLTLEYRHGRQGGG
jgi:hypothetical protein